MRLLHISDVHFYAFYGSFNGLFNKRLLGNFHGLLYRQFSYDRRFADQFITKAEKLQPDSVIISGDLTTTAHEKEFSLASHFIKKLQAFTKVFVVPGNHDAYLSSSRELFYKELGPLGVFPPELQTHRCATVNLDNNHSLVLIDNAVATPFFYSNGKVTTQQIAHLEQELKKLPQTNHITLVNHFPYHCTNCRKNLIEGELYLQLFKKFPNIKLYLSGHLHHQKILTSQKPYQLDCGSLTHKKGGFFCIDWEKDIATVNSYQRQDGKMTKVSSSVL